MNPRTVSILTGVHAVPATVLGMRALAVVAPDPEGRAAHAQVIAEGAGARPLTASLRLGLDGEWYRHDFMPVREGDLRTEWLAIRNWLNGGHRPALVEAINRPYLARLPVEDRIMGRHFRRIVAAALPGCGFSPRFVGILKAVSGWDPTVAGIQPEGYDALCAEGAAGDALRRFCEANPVVVQTLFREAAAASVAGEVDPAKVLLGLTAAKLRRLSSHRWLPVSDGRRGGTWFETIRKGGVRGVVELAAAVPPEWIPVTMPEILAFRRTVESLPRLGLDRRTLVDSSKGRWREFLARCDAVVPEDRWRPDWNGHSAYVHDPVEDLVARLVRPALCHAGFPLARTAGLPWSDRGKPVDDRVRAVAASLAYGGMSLPALLETARRWHVAQAAINAALPASPGLREWPALSPVTEVDGLLFVPVHTVDALAEEGAAGPDRDGVDGLHHCVASYLPRAKAGKLHIVSVRRPRDGAPPERVATAEIRQNRDGACRVDQLRGHRNATPPADAMLAVQRYAEIRRPYVPPRDAVEDHVADECGYDWRDRDLLARALAAYAPLLPRPLRDLDAFLARLGEEEGRSELRAA